jgi:hypothetical protein
MATALKRRPVVQSAAGLRGVETTIRVDGLPIVVRQLPAEAARWAFTPHAMEKMGERHVGVVAALRAVCAPTSVRVGGVDIEIRKTTASQWWSRWTRTKS